MSSPHGPGGAGRPWTPGNPGRRPGSKNKRTLIAAELLDSAGPELLRTAIERAKRGNIPLLKFLLDRWLPRHRLISIDLPQITCAADALKALRSILRAVSDGAITPTEAASFAALLAPFIDETTPKSTTREITPSLADHLRSPEKD